MTCANYDVINHFALHKEIIIHKTHATVTKYCRPKILTMIVSNSKQRIKPVNFMKRISCIGLLLIVRRIKTLIRMKDEIIL